MGYLEDLGVPQPRCLSVSSLRPLFQPSMTDVRQRNGASSGRALWLDTPMIERIGHSKALKTRRNLIASAAFRVVGAVFVAVGVGDSSIGGLIVGGGALLVGGAYGLAEARYRL